MYMEKLHFSVNINASKEKVWQTLWDDTTYRKWTSAFHETSYAVTDNWKEGTKVLFLDGNGSGMVSTVAANKAPDFMSFKHLGEVKDGIEDTTSEKVKAWSGALENYTLAEANGITTVHIEMDCDDSFKEMFSQMWPKALEKLKQIAEKS